MKRNKTSKALHPSILDLDFDNIASMCDLVKTPLEQLTDRVVLLERHLSVLHIALHNIADGCEDIMTTIDALPCFSISNAAKPNKNNKQKGESKL